MAVELRDLQGLPPEGELFSLHVQLSESPPTDSSVYDLCIAFPMEEGVKRDDYDLSPAHMDVLERIIQCIGRKYIYMYNSLWNRTRFVMIRGGTSRLKSKAEQLRIKLLLDPKNAQLEAFRGDPDRGIGRVEIVHREDATTIGPYEHIYGRYVMDPDMEHLYARVENSNNTEQGEVMNREENASSKKSSHHIFKKTVRVELLLNIISDSVGHGGANVNLREMTDSGEIHGYYALHNSKPAREKLVKSILKDWYALSVDELKEYFGEKIAMYFAFTSHYASWLVLPGILGLGCQLPAIILWDWNRIEACAFALFISIFCVITFEHWKRKEKTLAMQWGSLDTEGSENNIDTGNSRPGFEGTEIKSYIDGQNMLYFEKKNSWKRSAFSACVVFILCFVSMGTVGALYLLRSMLLDSFDSSLSQIMASVVNALVIIILNQIVSVVARALCSAENHRTDAEFEQSLTIKQFVFCFINSFASLYYLAFGAKFLTGTLGVSSEEGDYDATKSVAINLFSIFVVRYCVMSFVKYCAPWCKHWAVKFYKSENKCRGTTAAIKWFFCSAAKKFVCRFFCCNVDLAYEDDTYDSYRFQDTISDRMYNNNDYGAEEKEPNFEELEASALAASKKAKNQYVNIGYSSAEKQHRMTEYDKNGMTEQYVGQVMVLGYMTLFVAALPGAVTLGMITMLLEMRGDIWLMLHRYRRPLPQSAESIGLWKDIMELMTVIAVCTNAGLTVFTMTTFDDYSDFKRMGIFIGFHYLVFSIQYLIGALINDEPSEVKIQRARNMFLSKKLVDKVPDKEGVDPLALL